MLEPDLQLELGPPPVAALGVVSDRVAGPHADPLRNRPVLLQLLGELHLDAEGLVGRLETDHKIINLMFDPGTLTEEEGKAQYG